MSEQARPLLSVGIIFKNEIRCLERCLESFLPLREKLPLEIVMADTGSDDGSRAVAARYADVLVDFPWVGDFAAARNAVLERCSGAWCLMADADEWLDTDTSELEALPYEGGGAANKGMVIQRNYRSAALGESYGDLLTPRLLRMSAHPRYEGAIHEQPVFPGEGAGGPAFLLRKTVLHHDGYVDFGTERGRAKRERNLALLRARLEKDPDDLDALQHYLSSGGAEADYVERLRHAVALVESGAPYRETVGPPLLRRAVEAAYERKLPERDAWLALDRRLFPDSVFTRVDVNYVVALHAAQNGDYAECLRPGEDYLAALDALEGGDPKLRAETAFGLLLHGDTACRRTLTLTLARACACLERPERAEALLAEAEPAALDAGQIRLALETLREARVRSGRDAAESVTALWEGLSLPKPDEAAAEARKAAFHRAGAAFFATNPEIPPGREPWGLFLPLEGAEGCALGDAAAMMETEDPARLEALLLRQSSLAELPAPALARALTHGVRPPLSGRALDVEEADALAAALREEKATLYALAAEAAAGDLDDRQALLWARGLALAALDAFDWETPEEESADGMDVLRAFAATERVWLPRCYAPEALADGHVLPPVHRFGHRLVGALDALDAGDFLESVKALRAALDTCKDMKPAVEFLLAEVQRREKERARENAPPELLALAEKVRAILAAYPPGDPAVAVLKQSEAYQKVAYLIEE